MLTDMPSRWWSFLASPAQAKVDASTGDAIVRCEQSTASAVDVEVSRFATRIHQRPLARTNPSVGGIHAWAFVKATDPDATLTAAIPLLLSILLMYAQSAMVYTVAYEAASPRCSKHEHCPAGAYCGPKDFSPVYGEPVTRQPWRHEKAPGFCFDCYWTSENASGSKFRGRNRGHSQALAVPVRMESQLADVWSNASFAVGAGWFAHSGAEDLTGEQWFRDAAAYCDANDILPFRCDHLVERQSRLAAAHYVVIVFVVLLVLMPLVEDWDEAALETRLLRHPRAIGGELPGGELPLWIRCLAWVHIRVRMFALPFCLVSATCALLFNDETCTEFLLDGLAITFTTFTDDLLAQFLLPNEERQELGAAIEALVAEESGHACPQRFLKWLFNRLYAAVLGVAVVAVNLEPESFMVTFGPDWVSPYRSLSCETCSKLLGAVSSSAVSYWATYGRSCASSPSSHSGQSGVRSYIWLATGTAR